MPVFSHRILTPIIPMLHKHLLVPIGLSLVIGCSDNFDLAGVNSPVPGILQVYITSNESDRTINIAGQTFTVTGDSTEFLHLVVAQGRAYSDANSAVLYNGLAEYRELTQGYNIIDLDDDGAYQEYLIFYSFLPPAFYDSLKIAFSSDFISIGSFQIPVGTPADAEYLQLFEQRFEIQEEVITEIHLILNPFESLKRVKNTYEFQRLIFVDRVVITAMPDSLKQYYDG